MRALAAPAGRPLKTDCTTIVVYLENLFLGSSCKVRSRIAWPWHVGARPNRLGVDRLIFKEQLRATESKWVHVVAYSGTAFLAPQARIPWTFWGLRSDMSRQVTFVVRSNVIEKSLSQADSFALGRCWCGTITLSLKTGMYHSRFTIHCWASLIWSDWVVFIKCIHACCYTLILSWRLWRFIAYMTLPYSNVRLRNVREISFTDKLL